MSARRKRPSQGPDSRQRPGLCIVPPNQRALTIIPAPPAPKRARKGPLQSQIPPAAPQLLQAQPVVAFQNTLALSSSTFGPHPGDVQSTSTVQYLTQAQIHGSGFPLTAGQTAADAEEYLFNQTHEQRVALEKSQQATTNTGDTYGRHIKNYHAFWNQYQDDLVRQNPNWPRIPALPINATKAAIFIEYESKREKRKRKSSDGVEEYRTGTTLGVQSILQAVSALEKERFMMAHHYRHDPSSQAPLRDDPRIKSLEAAARHNEASRFDSSQKLKAAGTSADTYTTAELQQLSNYLLGHPNTKSKLVVAIRDRAMLLLASQMAFRGQNLRDLLLSDIFTSLVPNTAAGDEKFFELLALLTDHGKTNQHGRVDEHGALRHKHVSMCGIGALALWLFTLFHKKLGAEPLPDFAPDFSSEAQRAGFGEFGKRPWYGLFTFKSSTGTCQQQISYSNHYDRIVLMNQANGISITKVTHAGRARAAQTARLHGATVADTKAMGGWSETGSFRSCYDRTHPIGALLGAAHHVADRPEAYFVARSALVPPPELQLQIFPWIEEQESALEARALLHAPSKDIALAQFLKALRWFRIVLLQDMAALYDENSHWHIFHYAPFNTASFRGFAEGAGSRIKDAEGAARLALENLPERLTAAFCGAMTQMSVKQAEEQAETRRIMRELQQQNQQLSDRLAMGKEPEATSGRHRRGARVPLAQATNTSLSTLAYPPVIQTPPTYPYPPHHAAPQYATAPTLSAALAAVPASIALPALTAPPPALTASPAFSAPPTFSAPPGCSGSQPAFSAPPALNAPPAFNAGPMLSSTPPPFSPPPSSDGSPPALSTPPAFSAPPTLAVPPTSNAVPVLTAALPAFSTPPAFTGSPALPVFNAAGLALTPPPAFAAPPTSSSTQPAFIPHGPNSTSPTFNGLPHVVLPMPPYDASLKPSHAALADDWKRICERYEHTKVLAHAWFVDGRRRWVPSYSFSPETLLASVWREWHEGLDGKFSVEALSDGWDCAWRENVKSVYSKRLRVITFVRKLKNERQWTTTQAIRFLEASFSGTVRCTTLYTQLTQHGKEGALLASAKKHRF